MAMVNIPAPLSRALEAFDPQATAEALARALAGSPAGEGKSPRMGIKGHLGEFLMWPLLGPDNGYHVFEAAGGTQSHRARLHGTPDQVWAHFQALAPVVLPEMAHRLETVPNQAAKEYDALWTALVRWQEQQRDRHEGAVVGRTVADVFLLALPHLNGPHAQRLLKALLSVQGQGARFAERVAFLDRLTEADALTALAGRKVGFPPMELLIHESLGAGALLGDGDREDPKDTAGTQALLAERQAVWLERVRAQPGVLRLDLTPVPDAERGLKGMGRTPQRAQALIEAVLPLFAAKGKASVAEGLASLMTGPKLDRALDAADLDAATAFFREHPGFTPAGGWGAVLDRTLEGATMRAAKAVATAGLDAEARLAETAAAGEFVAGMLAAAEGKLKNEAAAEAVRQTARRWSQLFDQSAFLAGVVDAAPAFSDAERADAIGQLKLVFANPFLDTLAQERARLDPRWAQEGGLNAAQVLVTLLDAQAPKPSARGRIKP